MVVVYSLLEALNFLDSERGLVKAVISFNGGKKQIVSKGTVPEVRKELAQLKSRIDDPEFDGITFLHDESNSQSVRSFWIRPSPKAAHKKSPMASHIGLFAFAARSESPSGNRVVPGNDSLCEQMHFKNRFLV